VPFIVVSDLPPGQIGSGRPWTQGLVVAGQRTPVGPGTGRITRCVRDGMATMMPDVRAVGFDIFRIVTDDAPR